MIKGILPIAHVFPIAYIHVLYLLGKLAVACQLKGFAFSLQGAIKSFTSHTLPTMFTYSTTAKRDLQQRDPWSDPTPSTSNKTFSSTHSTKQAHTYAP